jgi:predicted AAA+ superfamily ATPase
LRTVQGTIHEKVEKGELGYLFETFLMNEMRALDSYTHRNGTLSYWRTESGSEVDCIWTYGRKNIGFEFKFTDHYKSEFNRSLLTLLETKKIQAAYGVYTGERALKMDSIWVFPYREFLRRFKEGDL